MCVSPPPSHKDNSKVIIYDKLMNAAIYSAIVLRVILCFVFLFNCHRILVSHEYANQMDKQIGLHPLYFAQ